MGATRYLYLFHREAFHARPAQPLKSQNSSFTTMNCEASPRSPDECLDFLDSSTARALLRWAGGYLIAPATEVRCAIISICRLEAIKRRSGLTWISAQLHPFKQRAGRFLSVSWADVEQGEPHLTGHDKSLARQPRDYMQLHPSRGRAQASSLLSAWAEFREDLRVVTAPERSTKQQQSNVFRRARIGSAVARLEP